MIWRKRCNGALYMVSLIGHPSVCRITTYLQCRRLYRNHLLGHFPSFVCHCCLQIHNSWLIWQVDSISFQLQKQNTFNNTQTKKSARLGLNWVGTTVWYMNTNFLSKSTFQPREESFVGSRMLETQPVPVVWWQRLPLGPAACQECYSHPTPGPLAVWCW